MNKQTQRQLLLLLAIALIALVGIGLIAFLAGTLIRGSEEQNSTTAVDPLPTETPLPLPVVTIQGIKSQAKLWFTGTFELDLIWKN
jgi:hypothetical protein